MIPAGDANSTLEGFTIIGGRYGIKCTNYAPGLIRRCTIRNNVSNYDGIYLETVNNPASIQISRCRIMNSQYGIRMSSGSSSVDISNCVIAKNTYGGVYGYSGTGSRTIRNCTIYGNTTYGICRDSGNLSVTNSIIWSNGDESL